MAIYIWHLTELGIELMQACKPREQMQLEKYQNESHELYIAKEFSQKYEFF